MSQHKISNQTGRFLEEIRAHLKGSRPCGTIEPITKWEASLADNIPNYELASVFVLWVHLLLGPPA
jgi:hypothetical protein